MEDIQTQLNRGLLSPVLLIIDMTTNGGTYEGLIENVKSFPTKTQAYPWMKGHAANYAIMCNVMYNKTEHLATFIFTK